MAYDTSISVDISLSKILDQMIADGTDFGVVKTFLLQHKRDIKDIYSNSCMVYDLYDVVSNYKNIFASDGFLLSNICNLNDADLFYAWATIIGYAKGNRVGLDIIREFCDMDTIKKRLGKFVQYGKYAMNGHPIDEKIIKYDSDLAEVLNQMSSASNDDIEKFVKHSYFLRTAFTPRVFNSLYISTQYSLVRVALDIIKSSTRNNYYYFSRGTVYFYKVIADCCLHIIMNFMKQLLALNDVETFNWFVSIIKTFLKENIGLGDISSDLKTSFPSSIADIIKNRGDIADIVFEMNLVDSQFDTTNLFLYIYIFDNALADGLRDNYELVDFFNPVFDWRKLDLFAQVENGSV